MTLPALRIYDSTHLPEFGASRNQSRTTGLKFSPEKASVFLTNYRRNESILSQGNFGAITCKAMSDCGSSYMSARDYESDSMDAVRSRSAWRELGSKGCSIHPLAVRPASFKSLRRASPREERQT